MYNTDYVYYHGAMYIESCSVGVYCFIQEQDRYILRDTTIRLIDFGLAVYSYEYRSCVVATQPYQGPEIILSELMVMYQVLCHFNYENDCFMVTPPILYNHQFF